MTVDPIARNRELNDELRRLCAPPGCGTYLLTSGVESLGDEVILEALEAVANFQEFDDGHNLSGEHECGAVHVAGHRIFWKIFKCGCIEGLVDPAQVTRVMTVMLASEY